MLTSVRTISKARTPWLQINYYMTKMRGLGLNLFIFRKLNKNKNIKEIKKNPVGRLGFAC